MLLEKLCSWDGKVEIIVARGQVQEGEKELKTL